MTYWISFRRMKICELSLGILIASVFSLRSLAFIYPFCVFFSNYIRHTESERTSDVIQMSEEAEPNVVGYPAQHGIRKHGRWNSRPRHVNIYI